MVIAQGSALGDALALASALCFAGSSITIARGAPPGADDNGAFVSLLITVAISGALWVVLGLARGFGPVTPRALLWFAGAGVLTAFVGRVFLYASVQRLGAMRASAIKRLQPFFAVVLGLAVLGESLRGPAALGAVLIVASFAVLVAGSASAGARHESLGRRLLNAGYLYGPVSALGYATGYLLRKLGLAEAPDALLGTLVGCCVGAGLFLAAALVRPRYAAAVRATFATPNPWFVGAGVLASFGQIFYYGALNESPMSRVALLASMEVFATLLLGVLFLRRRESLTPALLLAAVLGFAGSAAIVAF